MITDILKDLRELRDEMVQKNWPAQRLSNIILKYETKQLPKETMAVHDETYEQNFFSGYNAAFFIDLVDSIESSGGTAKLYDEAITVSDSSDGTDFYIVSNTSDQAAGSLGSDIFVLGFGTGINSTDSYFTNSVLGGNNLIDTSFDNTKNMIIFC